MQAAHPCVTGQASGFSALLTFLQGRFAQLAVGLLSGPHQGGRSLWSCHGTAQQAWLIILTLGRNPRMLDVRQVADIVIHFNVEWED